MLVIRKTILVQAKVEGNLKVYFYDTEAGSRDVKATVIPARTFPQVLPT